MDALGTTHALTSEFLPKDILGRLESLYPKLSPISSLVDPLDALGFAANSMEMPPLETLSTRVSQCSFRVFADPAAFFQSPRAKQFVSWSAPRNDAYRIYFNTQSGKVYVDLNGKRWDEIRSKLEEEILFCEILRTLIWVLTCEVELHEAREADKNGDRAVTSEVTEVVIP